jgi:hypothetical protein
MNGSDIVKNIRGNAHLSKKHRNKTNDYLKHAIELIGVPLSNLTCSLFTNEEQPPIEKVSDIKHRLPYIGSTKKFSDHIGQRKLILNEIQFLKNTNSEYCIYAGSAPGNKTHYLSQLFPDIKLILVDPNKFDLKLPDGKSHRSVPHVDIVHMSTAYPTRSNVAKTSNIIEYIQSSKCKIFIFEEYMTIKMANKFKDLNCSFISDIRSNIYLQKYPTDFDIYWNTSMMYNWITIMQPNMSMLKIRMPYGSDTVKTKDDDYIINEFKMSKKNGIDFLNNYNDNRFFMSKSELFIQPWAPVSSSELRMIILKKDISNIVEYDIKDIEDKMFYYNTINRTWVFHYNPNSNKDINFCHCNDCALENKIWTDYGYNKKQIHSVVQKLGTITGRPLSRSHSYPLYEKLNNKQILNRVKSWRSSNHSVSTKINKGDFGLRQGGYIESQSISLGALGFVFGICYAISFLMKK